MGRLLAALAVLIAAAACDRPAADQLLVRIVDGTGGRLQVPADLDSFEVRVASLRGPLDGGTALVRYRRSFRLAGAGSGGVTLPQTLAVVPADGSPGTVRIDVFGLKNGRVLQRIHRTSAFGVGLVEFPPFALTPLCFGVTCPPGQTCEADGTCRDADDPCGSGGCDAGTGPCGASQVACGDECIPLDDDNCGGCGVACPEGERCLANVCACAAGGARCGGACVDLTSDPAHCGECGRACNLPNATAECTAGSCEIASCDPGFLDCNGVASDGCESEECVDDAPCTTSCGSTGSSVCGGCGTTCEPPPEQCNGADDDCDGLVDECDDAGAVCFEGACAYPPVGCVSAHTFGGHLYAVCDDPVDWFFASDVCLGWGGYLVTIDDTAEDDFVRSIAPGQRWIGLSDWRFEGTFEWEGAPSGFRRWCPGEPSATCCYGEYPGCFGGAPGHDEDCTVTGTGCGWADEHCCIPYGFVCEGE